MIDYIENLEPFDVDDLIEISKQASELQLPKPQWDIRLVLDVDEAQIDALGELAGDRCSNFMCK